MLTLTDQENQKVSQQRKKDAQLPTYFNAKLGKAITISRDYEAFLILQSQDTKQTMIQWLSDVRKVQESQTDRDALVVSAIDLELTDSEQKVTEIADQLTKFENFRSKVQASKYSGVIEVGSLLTDLQRGIEELAVRRDRTTHLVTVATVLQETIKGLTANEEKQFESWNESLSAY